jgi:hypothetical protein
MFQDLLILLTAVFCLTTLVYIAKRDDVSAVAYLTLFVYTIFTQIGYVHYPQLSANHNVYFGQELFYPYWSFMLLSFAACFVGFTFFHGRHLKKPLIVQNTPRAAAKRLFRCIVICILLYLGVGFVQYAPELGYGMRQASEVSTGCVIFLLIYRFYALVIVILYANCNLREGRAVSLLLFIPSALIYLAIAMTVGSRGDILYLTAGVVFFHLHPLAYTLRKRLKTVALIFVFGLVVLYSLSVLEYVRARFSPVTFDTYASSFAQPQQVFDSDQIAEMIVAKDYYWPSHLLMVAMKNHVIDPAFVLRSNIGNSLVGLHIENLSDYLCELADGTSQNLGGLAFHLFVEGYVAAGWLGWLYNGLTWNLGLLLLRSVIRTSDVSLNHLLTAMLIVIIPNAMRWQASVFIRALWSLFLPAMVLALLSTGKMPQFRIARRRHNPESSAASLSECRP